MVNETEIPSKTVRTWLPIHIWMILYINETWQPLCCTLDMCFDLLYALLLFIISISFRWVDGFKLTSYMFGKVSLSFSFAVLTLAAIYRSVARSSFRIVDILIRNHLQQMSNSILSSINFSVLNVVAVGQHQYISIRRRIICLSIRMLIYLLFLTRHAADNLIKWLQNYRYGVRSSENELR